MNALTAWFPSANCAGVGTGSNAPRIASDQPRNGPRSATGTPSRLPITSTGMAAAKSSMRSAVPPIASSNRSTRARKPISRPPMARGVSAPAIRRRTRLCNGGSLNTSDVV